MSLTKKNDFIEIEFIGRVKDGEVFDTNVPSEAKKIGIKLDEYPLVVCIGKGMVIEGLDSDLSGKEISKEYQIEIPYEKAFGPRIRELVRLIPKNLFLEQKVNPKPGMTLALDNNLVKIVSVSGGRVLCDFNSPLAGKAIIYNFKIKKVVDDNKEKVNSLLDFFLRKRLKFEINENKVIFDESAAYKSLIDMLNEKFKDVLCMEMVLKEEAGEKDGKNPQGKI
ncbi:MAG: peptidylprolyl isomerase [Candidatus Pacearchaeota archaeon]